STRRFSFITFARRRTFFFCIPILPILHPLFTKLPSSLTQSRPRRKKAGSVSSSALSNLSIPPITQHARDDGAFYRNQSDWEDHGFSRELTLGTARQSANDGINLVYSTNLQRNLFYLLCARI
ncbi:hypothetical protein ARMGADRAFT_1057790, partial [Armillaria gallica]